MKVRPEPDLAHPAPKATALAARSATRYTFHTIPHHLRDCEQWPSASPPSAKAYMSMFPNLPKEEAENRALLCKERFDRFQRAIKVYMQTGSLKKAVEEAKCDKSVFYDQLNRCLTPKGDSIVGWAGIILNFRVADYTRRADGPGTAGRFEKWLADNPEWQTVLDQMIIKGAGGEIIPGRAPDVRTVTRNFIYAFRKKIPAETYPHTGKNGATTRRTIERYVKHYVAMHREVTEVWFGEDVANRQHLGTGLKSFDFATRPFDVIGIDAHRIDCIGFVIIDALGGEQRVAVTRIQLVVAICHCKRVATGYSIAIRKEVNAGHVEEAVVMGNTPWKPKELTIEGLAYADGAGFPNGVVEGVSEINPASLRMDNGAVNYAKGIRSQLRQTLACSILWGGVGNWWRNAITERFFGILERYGFKRLPSSMGSGTQDPHRADNPVLEATGKGIHWDELVQVTDVLIANYNARPHSALGGVSPLESLRATLTGRFAPVMRMRAPHTNNSPRLGIQIEHRVIAGGVSRRKAPYVEFGEVEYTSTDLSPRYDWLGKAVTVHYGRDIRTIEVYLETGEWIGVLEVQHRGWRLSAHTLETRQVINQRIREGEMYVPEGGDPIVAYLRYLEKKAVASASEKHVSQDASALADFLLSSGAKKPPPSFPKTTSNEPQIRRPTFRGMRLPPEWT